MVLVDILIPHYSDLAGLRDSLTSIVQQTLRDPLRVIVVDDGSPQEVADQVPGLLQSFELEFLYHRFPSNRGRPAVRNKLVELAAAPYLAWLDAGDRWYADKLSLQLERFGQLELAGADVSRVWMTCDYDWRWSGRAAEFVEQDVDSDQLKELLLGKRLRAYLWSVLAPTCSFKQLGPFDEELPRLQDLDMFIRFVAAQGRLEKPSVEPARALCVYEKSDVGRDAKQIRACNERIFKKYASLYRNYGKPFVTQTRLNAELLSARFAKNNGDRLLMGYYLARAVALAPSRVPSEFLRRISKRQQASA